MLPLSEIARLRDAVDSDRRSPVADTARLAEAGAATVRLRARSWRLRARQPGVGGRHADRLRQVVEAERSWFTAVNALRSLARLGPVLAEDPAAGREVVAGVASRQPLRSVHDDYAARHQHLAADLVPLLR